MYVGNEENCECIGNQMSTHIIPTKQIPHTHNCYHVNLYK